MKKITSTVELREAIHLLETKKASEVILLKAQFKETYESIRPVNLIKNTLHELSIAPDFKGDILAAVLSIVSGYLSKKMVVSETAGPVKQLLGTILQFTVTRIVSKNSQGIKTKISELIAMLVRKQKVPA